MRILSFAVGALCLAQTLAGQPETFDIATFASPPGWSRSDVNGVLLLQNRKTILGHTQFCQIYLFPSHPGGDQPEQNFAGEWETRVRGALKIASQPSPTQARTRDGWTVVTAAVDTFNQVPMRVLLSSVTGFGRVFSVMVVASPNSYAKELNSFFLSLNFHQSEAGSATPAPAVPVPAPPAASAEPPHGSAPLTGGSLGGYIFSPPPQWSRQESRDRVVLTSPVYQNGERCQITILPMQKAPAQRLPDLAIGTFRNIFKADPLTTYPSPPPKLASGISPAGWEFFTVRKLVGGQEGDGKGIGTILLAAKVGDRVGMIYGVSKDFIVSNCFGELVRDVWPVFFYSLQFQGADPGQQQNLVRQKLAGSWIIATGTVGGHYTFHSDGRYASTGAARQVTALNSTEVLATTTAYFGDGSYAFDGNQIVLTGDDGRKSTFFFRLQTSSRDSGRTWSDELCLLTPGASGEVCYRKE